MTQHSESKPKPTIDTAETKANQPKLTELSPDELDTVSGGQKVSTGDIHFTKLIDKSTP